MSYHELNLEERITIRVGIVKKLSLCEIARHAEITQKTGVAICFCDTHSPWQRGSNENINGLIRQYMPKGTDLPQHSQEELKEIVFSLNRRPRRRFGFRRPIDVLSEVMQKREGIDR